MSEDQERIGARSENRAINSQTGCGLIFTHNYGMRETQMSGVSHNVLVKFVRRRNPYSTGPRSAYLHRWRNPLLSAFQETLLLRRWKSSSFKKWKRAHATVRSQCLRPCVSVLLTINGQLSQFADKMPLNFDATENLNLSADKRTLEIHSNCISEIEISQKAIFTSL